VFQVYVGDMRKGANSRKCVPGYFMCIKCFDAIVSVRGSLFYEMSPVFCDKRIHEKTGY
jgi:hypothetical protein